MEIGTYISTGEQCKKLASITDAVPVGLAETQTSLSQLVHSSGLFLPSIRFFEQLFYNKILSCNQQCFI